MAEHLLVERQGRSLLAANLRMLAALAALTVARPLAACLVEVWAHLEPRWHMVGLLECLAAQAWLLAQVSACQAQLAVDFPAPAQPQAALAALRAWAVAQECLQAVHRAQACQAASPFQGLAALHQECLEALACR